MAIAFHPGETKPGTQEGGCRISALILGYDRRDTSLFEDFLHQRRRSIFEPATIIMAFLEVEKEKRFGEVRRRRSGLRRILHRTSSEEVIVTRPDRHKDADDNVGMYIHVSDLMVDALQTWRRQILSLETQVVGENPRLALELRQLALQYEHRLDRCDKILQGASLAYQMVRHFRKRFEVVLRPVAYVAVLGNDIFVEERRFDGDCRWEEGEGYCSADHDLLAGYIYCGM